MRAACIFLIAAALPALLYATEPPDLDDLLQKHMTALGGEQNIAGIVSVVSESEIEIVGTGMKGRLRSWSLNPCLFYSEISLGIFKVRQGYDGNKSWMVGPNGKLQFQQDELSIRRQVTSCFLDDFDYLLGPGRYSMAIAGEDTAAGAFCTVVEFTPKEGSPARLYFDRGTNLITRLVIDDGGGRTEQTFFEYKPAGGVMFPSRTITRQVSMNQVVKSTVVAIEVNRPVDPSIFLPPGEDARDYTFENGFSSTDIPFTYMNRHIYLPVDIGGEERIFLLDSGAGMTVIDSSLAGKMGLEQSGSLPGAGAGGAAKFTISSIDGFSVPGIEFSKQTVMIYPVSELTGAFSGIRIGGILGYDFLSRFITRIDYENSAISFFEPDLFTVPQETDSLEAPLINNIFSVKGRIDGRPEAVFFIDTGANSSVIQKRWSDGSGITDGREVMEISITGTGGREAAVMTRLDSLGLGNFRIKDPVFMIPSVTSGLGSIESVDGIIGNDVLERFTLWLDYDRQRIHLEANALFETPFYADRCGMMLGCGPDGSITVNMVLPGTPASEAGFLPGDRIEAVGGEKIEGCGSIGKVYKYFSRDEGTAVKVGFRRSGLSREGSVILKRYI